MMVKDWPVYFKNKLKVGNLESSVGIATLWTPSHLIHEKIDPSRFAVCGQLYSKKGINYIIRNILANPKIRYIIVCGNELSGSGEAMIKFKQSGIDENYNIIGVENAAIDKEIPREVLEKLREHIEVIDLRKNNDAVLVENTAASLSPAAPFMDPELFPEAQIESPSRFPAEPSLLYFRADTIGDAWLQILKAIMRFGYEKKMVHGGSVKSLHNLSVIIKEEDPKNPKIESFFNFTKNDFEKYYEQFHDPDRHEEDYTYGERLLNYNNLDQIKIIKEKLKRFPDDPGALAVLWDPHRDNPKPGKRGSLTPCLCLVQATVVDNKLHLTAYFRSNDMFDAWPRNSFALRRVQGEIAEEIGKDLGSLTTISNSAHIYETNWPQAEKIIKDNEKKMFCEWDPRGNLVISIDGENLIAEHNSPTGETLEKFVVSSREHAKPGFKMAEVLQNHNVVSNIGHALDIGQELMKAEIALKLGIEYIQDQPLKLART